MTTIKHRFVSAVADSGDPTLIQPSNWNDTHEIGPVPATHVLAGPTAGPDAEPSFRALAAGDIPALPYDPAGAAATAESNANNYTDGAVASLSTQYQPLDDQLSDLSALEYTGNALKVVRVNAGGTAFELGDNTGGGAQDWIVTDSTDAMLVNTAYALTASITKPLPATLEAGNWLVVSAIGGTVQISLNGHTSIVGIVGSVTGSDTLQLLNGETVHLVATSTSSMRVLSP